MTHIWAAEHPNIDKDRTNFRLKIHTNPDGDIELDLTTLIENKSSVKKAIWSDFEISLQKAFLKESASLDYCKTNQE